MEVVIIVLLAVLVVLSIVQMTKIGSKNSKNTTYLSEKDKQDIIKAFSSNITLIINALQNSAL